MFESLGKSIFDRINLLKQKEELEQKMAKMVVETEMKNKENNKIEFNKIIDEFLRQDKLDKFCLYQLIDKIEIDKDKNVYIYFNFCEPSEINT